MTIRTRVTTHELGPYARVGFPPPTHSPGPPAQKFADKSFTEVANTAKFAKVFTRESFRLYGIHHNNQEAPPSDLVEFFHFPFSKFQSMLIPLPMSMCEVCKFTHILYFPRRASVRVPSVHNLVKLSFVLYCNNNKTAFSTLARLDIRKQPVVLLYAHSAAIDTCMYSFYCGTCVTDYHNVLYILKTTKHSIDIGPFSFPYAASMISFMT